MGVSISDCSYLMGGIFERFIRQLDLKASRHFSDLLGDTGIGPSTGWP